MVPSADVSSLLTSGLLDSYLTPKLTMFELLRCTQVSREFRLSLQPDAVWKQALIRSLPPGHPSTIITSCRRAAYEYGKLQRAIESGDAAASRHAYAYVHSEMSAAHTLQVPC